MYMDVKLVGTNGNSRFMLITTYIAVRESAYTYYPKTTDKDCHHIVIPILYSSCHIAYGGGMRDTKTLDVGNAFLYGENTSGCRRT